MPRDLFGALVVRPVPRRIRRGVAIVSVIAHVITISALLVAQVLAVGPLPDPRQPAGFDWVAVRLADIELPPTPPEKPTPRRLDTNTPPGDVNAAPLQEPRGIVPETGLESARRIADVDVIPGVERGGPVASDSFGATIPPPPPPSQVPVRLHSGIQAPRKIVDEKPEYPALARQAHVEGIVIIEATIDAQGDVQAAKVLRSIPLLDQPAVGAVRHWKFTPALLNGVPVPVIITVTVNFRLQ